MIENFVKCEKTIGLTSRAAAIVIEEVKSRRARGLTASKTGIVSEAVIKVYGGKPVGVENEN